MKISYKSIMDQSDFVGALDRLGSDLTLPVKDRYAIARTRRDVTAAVEDYEKLRIELVKQFGVPEIDIRKREFSRIKEDDPDNPQVKHLETRIRILKDQDSIMIDVEDPKAVESFRKEMKELGDIEFEIFLDHKIALPETTTLTGKDISALIDLIEEP